MTLDIDFAKMNGLGNDFVVVESDDFHPTSGEVRAWGSRESGLGFDQLIATQPDVERFVRSPVFSADEQLKAVDAILTKAGITGLAANFIKVTASNRRLFAVQRRR